MSERLFLENSSEKEPPIIASLRENGFEVLDDPLGNTKEAYLLKLSSGDKSTEIRIIFHGYAGADLVITHIRTLPKNKIGEGLGSQALNKLLECAKKNNLTNIRAIEVIKDSESFWTKNGFTKDEEQREFNEFIYRGN